MTFKSNSFLKDVKVLSVEQAAALPYCTWRLAVDGANIVRIEPLWGDPNRKVGKKVIEEEDMNAYFMSVNAGKKAISLNLGHPQGQKILSELIEKLEIDIFTCNQLPGNYKKEYGLSDQNLCGYTRLFENGGGQIGAGDRE